MPRIQSHAHKLKRHRYKSTGSAIYFCILPDCTYKTDTHLTLGKRVVCWRCGKEFQMNEYAIRLAKPHCQDCHKTKAEYQGKEPEQPELTGVIASDSVQSLKDRLKSNISPFSAKADEDL